MLEGIPSHWWDVRGLCFAPASSPPALCGLLALLPLSVRLSSEQSTDLGWGLWEAPAAQTALDSSGKSLIDG